MGITVNSAFTTSEGFTVTNMYLSIDTIRLTKGVSDGNFWGTFAISAYIDRQSKITGKRAISLSLSLQSAESQVKPPDFYSKTLYGIAYEAIKAKWSSRGYQISNVLEEGQFAPDHFIYDCSGYNFEGFDHSGFNRQGYNANGFNADGFNVHGYNLEGFDKDGFDMMGYNASGVDRNGNHRPLLDLSGSVLAP
jgi:hypothetical protein